MLPDMIQNFGCTMCKGGLLNLELNPVQIQAAVSMKQEKLDIRESVSCLAELTSQFNNTAFGYSYMFDTDAISY